MTSPSYAPQVSLGNILTILTLIVGISVTWATGQAEVRAIRDQISAHDRRIVEMQAYIQGIARDHAAALAVEAGNVRALQTGAARHDARLDAILNALARIEARLDRAEGQRP